MPLRKALALLANGHLHLPCAVQACLEADGLSPPTFEPPLRVPLE